MELHFRSKVVSVSFKVSIFLLVLMQCPVKCIDFSRHQTFLGGLLYDVASGTEFATTVILAGLVLLRQSLPQTKTLDFPCMKATITKYFSGLKEIK